MKKRAHPSVSDKRRFLRRFGSTLRPIGFRLEVAAWLDLMLLLFYFTLTQSAMVLRPGLIVDLPEAPFTDGAPMDAHVITLTQEEFLFVDEQRTPMEGLDSILQQFAHTNPDTPVLIEADSRISHGVLAELYTKVSKAGIHRVILATRLPPRADRAP